MNTGRERSRSPHRSDSPGNKWKCKNCKTDNDNAKNKCGKCRLEKGQDKTDVFKEDWDCSKCNSNNFSRRIDCFKCQTRKPPADPKHPNDWECLKCKGNNFSRRLDCFKCKEPKPNFISAMDKPQQQEWSCGCGFKNFSHRINCWKCHAPKIMNHNLNHSSQNHATSRPYFDNMNQGGGSYSMNMPHGPVGGGGMMGGQSSGIMAGGGVMGGGMSRMRSTSVERGFRSRSPIRSLQSGIPERAPDVDPLTGESEWICPVCGIENFYKRFDCYRCHEKKPIDAVLASSIGGNRGYSDPMSGNSDHRQTGYIDMTSCSVTDYSDTATNINNIPTQQYPIPSHYTPFNNGGSNNIPPSGPLTIPKKRFATDWICPGCQGLNYSKRVDCYKCHAPKPENGDFSGSDATPVARDAAPSSMASRLGNNRAGDSRHSDVRSGDWVCPACLGNNFSRRTDCFKCKQPKPAEQNMEVPF